jgi:hypothetical protein
MSREQLAIFFHFALDKIRKIPIFYYTGVGGFQNPGWVLRVSLEKIACSFLYVYYMEVSKCDFLYS